MSGQIGVRRAVRRSALVAWCPLHFCSTKSQPYVITVVFKFLCRCNGYRGLRVVRIGVESLAYGVLEHHAPSLIHLNGRAAKPKASRWRPF